MQEETLYRQWQALARLGKAVYTAGHRLRVLQAGRLNSWRGPDFVAARFELDGVVYQGDVECHLQTQDWYRHQHHLDRAYSQVLLHVVPSGAAPEEVKHNLSGRAIPTVPLPELPAALPSVCPFKHFPAAKGAALLQALALERLRRKVRRFTAALANVRPEVVFHEAFLRAMGYPHNAQPFTQLAGRIFLPPGAAASFSNQELYALYAGQAGFLSAPSDAYAACLAAFYRQRQGLLQQAALPAQVWQFNGHRAGNHPHFRLAGALAFFSQYGWRPLEHLVTLLSERRPYALVQKELVQALSIGCEAYWQSHYALGRPMAQVRHRRYFGAARSAEILTNIILPLGCALALDQGSAGFAAYLEGLYLWLPAVVLYDGLQRRFSWLGQARREWPAHALNHGLLELQERYCLGPACADCPLFEIRCPVIDSQSKNDYTLNVQNKARSASTEGVASI